MVDSRGARTQDGRRAERLELRVPTTPTQLPAVRAMAGDLAMRMDYDLDAVEDLRLAVLHTLVDKVEAGPATQATVPAGDGGSSAVAVISMDKYLPGHHPDQLLGGSGQNVSVAR